MDRMAVEFSVFGRIEVWAVAVPSTWAAASALEPADEITAGRARLFFRSRASGAAAETMGADPAPRRASP